MKVIRVFPRRTRATPDDEDVRVATGPGLFDEADKVDISVTFTWDLPLAEKLEAAWRYVAPTSIGGPAMGEAGGDFIPGKYLKCGYIITSRGCPNRCWFCSVWKREGCVRELPIAEGWNVLDDNLLACSESHVRAVFSMLQSQEHPIDFSGGWEAARLKSWHIDLLAEISLHQVWFAFDTDDDLDPLIEAGKILREAGLSITKTGNVSHRVRCYCLIGYPKDTMEGAEGRLKTAYQNGFLPMAMLWKDEKGKQEYSWRRFHKYWARPASINSICRNNGTAIMEVRQ